MWWLANGQHDAPIDRGWLSTHERSHVDSIRFTKRRDEYLTRRWTAKQSIATVLGLGRSHDDLRRIEIRHRESGAPYVQVDGEMPAIDVSLTDRSGWAACVVGSLGTTAPGTLGIDLEVVEPRSRRFVTDYFTPTERAFMDAIPGGDFDEAANLIWSAKEAALKVRQVGLRVDTRTVEVELHGQRVVDGWTEMTVWGPDGAMPGWWRRFGVFLLTVAFAEPTEPPRLLPHGNDLDAATPIHTWVDAPTC